MASCAEVKALKGMSIGSAILGYLQKLGKSLMLPVACMPLCGILMGIGYLLCPAAMQGGDIAGITAQIGFFLVKAGGAILDNISVLFVIGVGLGMSDDRDGVGALAAIVSWFIITALLTPANIVKLFPQIEGDRITLMAFEKIANPFIGILCGILGSACFNKFKNTKFPQWLSFFSGKRCVAIICGIFSLIIAAILCFVWPVVFSGLVALGNGIAKMGAVGAGIYATLNRLLIPFGLHHALNNVFWFDTIGLGDLTNFWAGKTSADVSWSLGMYMSGFFPCMMFGIPGAAFAIYKCADKNKRRAITGILLGSAVCSFICGVTEPFEFSFMFVCPLLYVVYSLLYGIFTFVTVALGFRAGFSFSAGLMDLGFSSTLPAAEKTWLIIPLGIAAFAVFFGVFYLIIKASKKNPLEGMIIEENPKETYTSSDEKYRAMAEKIIKGLGGSKNIISVDNCITRLRLELHDTSIVDEKLIKSAGSPGVIRLGKNGIQVVIGTDVQFVADELKLLWQKGDDEQDEAEKILIAPPCEGELIKMEDIDDPVFSEGVLGPCFGIKPVSGEIKAPASGKVIQVVETLHSVCIDCDGAEVLVHVGIDTVKLKGKGFKCSLKVGDTVEKGQIIIEADLNEIKNNGFSDTVVTVITNADDFGEVVLSDKDNLYIKNNLKE